MTINRFQNRQLHLLLTQTKLMGQKQNLVLGFSNGRTEESSKLLASEAARLIKYLQGLTPTLSTGREWEAANKMRRKILSMCHRIKWEATPGGGIPKVDMERLNNWCKYHSYLKKELNAYTYKELPKLVSEFQKVYRYYITKVSA